jgi:hypothetical protein
MKKAVGSQSERGESDDRAWLQQDARCEKQGFYCTFSGLHREWRAVEIGKSKSRAIILSAPFYSSLAKELGWEGPKASQASAESAKVWAAEVEVASYEMMMDMDVYRRVARVAAGVG